MLNAVTDLSDPALWARPDLPEIIDDLRGEGPVQLTATAEDGPVWSVISYREAVQVLRSPVVFLSLIHI